MAGMCRNWSKAKNDQFWCKCLKMYLFKASALHPIVSVCSGGCVTQAQPRCYWWVGREESFLTDWLIVLSENSFMVFTTQQHGIPSRCCWSKHRIPKCPNNIVSILQHFQISQWSKFILLLKYPIVIYLFSSQAEGQNAKNQQMDPFTRRQCKPTMVSNVSSLRLFHVTFPPSGIK